jgi:hypothetical protein
MPTIVVYRPSDVRLDRNRLYRVFIDDRMVGEVWAAQSVAFDVKPGQHAVRVKIDVMGSNTVSVSLKQLETAELACRGGGSLWALWRTVFFRNRYLDLHPMTDAEREDLARLKEQRKPPTPRNLGGGA